MFGNKPNRGTKRGRTDGPAANAAPSGLPGAVEERRQTKRPRRGRRGRRGRPVDILPGKEIPWIEGSSYCRNQLGIGVEAPLALDDETAKYVALIYLEFRYTLTYGSAAANKQINTIKNKLKKDYDEVAFIRIQNEKTNDKVQFGKNITERDVTTTFQYQIKNRQTGVSEIRQIDAKGLKYPYKNIVDNIPQIIFNSITAPMEIPGSTSGSMQKSWVGIFEAENLIKLWNEWCTAKTSGSAFKDVLTEEVSQYLKQWGSRVVSKKVTCFNSDNTVKDVNEYKAQWIFWTINNGDLGQDIWVAGVTPEGKDTYKNLSLSEKRNYFNTRGDEVNLKNVFINRLSNETNASIKLKNFMDTWMQHREGRVKFNALGQAFFEVAKDGSLKLKPDLLDIDDAVAGAPDGGIISPGTKNLESPGMWFIVDVVRKHSVLVIIKNNKVFTIGAGVQEDVGSFTTAQLLVLSPDSDVLGSTGSAGEAGYAFYKQSIRSFGFYNKKIRDNLQTILNAKPELRTDGLLMPPNWSYRMVQVRGASCPMGAGSYNCTSLAEAIAGNNNRLNYFFPRPIGYPGAGSGVGLPAASLDAAAAVAPAAPRAFTVSAAAAAKREGSGGRKTRRKRRKPRKKIKYKSSNNRRKKRTRRYKKKKRTRRYKKKKRSKRKTRR